MEILKGFLLLLIVVHLYTFMGYNYMFLKYHTERARIGAVRSGTFLAIEFLTCLVLICVGY